MKMTRWIGAVALVGVLAACADTSPTGDAPTGDVDDSPARIVNFPNHFMNVAFKCLGPNGIYAHTRPAAPVIVANDPLCKGTTNG